MADKHKAIKKGIRREAEYIKATVHKKGDTRAQMRKRRLIKNARSKKLNTQGNTLTNLHSRMEAQNRKENAKDATPKQARKYNRRSLEKRHLNNKITKAANAEMDREFAKRNLSRSKNQRADRVIEGKSESWLVKQRVERHSETLKTAKKVGAKANKGLEDVKARQDKVAKQTNTYNKRSKKSAAKYAKRTKLRLAKSRRGMIGQRTGGGNPRSPKVKK